MSSHLSHSWINPLIKCSSLGRHGAIDVSAKLLIAEFIPFLKFTVFWQHFLNCVISQMNFSLSNCQGIRRGSGPYVAIAIPIAFYVSVYAGHKKIVTKVKFPFTVKKRFLDVLLNYISAICPVSITLLYFNCSTYFI